MTTLRCELCDVFETMRFMFHYLITDREICRRASLVANHQKFHPGLAGVYDIGDHYEFESWRGIEDISAMARAADGPENFDRLSPTHVVSNLPDRTR